MRPMTYLMALVSTFALASLTVAEDPTHPWDTTTVAPGGDNTLEVHLAGQCVEGSVKVYEGVVPNPDPNKESDWKQVTAVQVSDDDSTVEITFTFTPPVGTVIRVTGQGLNSNPNPNPEW